jgi:hypothetical protein
MKLEAVDKKNPHLICCATIGAVNGTAKETRVLWIRIRGSMPLTNGSRSCYFGH